MVVCRSKKLLVSLRVETGFVELDCPRFAMYSRLSQHFPKLYCLLERINSQCFQQKFEGVAAGLDLGASLIA